MNILYSTKFEKHWSLNAQSLRTGYSKIDVKTDLVLFVLIVYFYSFFGVILYSFE